MLVLGVAQGFALQKLPIAEDGVERVLQLSGSCAKGTRSWRGWRLPLPAWRAPARLHALRFGHVARDGVNPLVSRKAPGTSTITTRNPVLAAIAIFEVDDVLAVLQLTLLAASPPGRRDARNRGTGATSAPRTPRPTIDIHRTPRWPRRSANLFFTLSLDPAVHPRTRSGLSTLDAIQHP